MEPTEADKRWDEICKRAESFFDAAGGRQALEKLTSDLNDIERAAFVEAVRHNVDFATVAISMKNRRQSNPSFTFQKQP